MDFAAGVIFFNEAASLKRCLDSLTDFDRVYCVDGRFPMYPGTSELSTDGSREIVKQYPNAELADCFGDEVEKRNRYLELAARDGIKYVLIIDADEWLSYKDWQLFRKECESLATPSIYRMFAFDGVEGFYRQPRLVHHPELFEYFLSHCVFRFKPTRYYANHGEFSTYVVKGFRIMSDDSLRSDQHLQDLETYQKRLVNYEGVTQFANIEANALPVDKECCVYNRAAPTGWVRETLLVEEGKPYALMHDVDNGKYEKKEIPVSEAYEEVKEYTDGVSAYKVMRNIVTNRVIRRPIKPGE
jgi:hypothetical protein